MKYLLSVFLTLIMYIPVSAKTWDVILYCNARAPVNTATEREHWKSEIPDLGINEVITSHYVVAKQGGKRLYHAIVEKSADNSKQFNRLKTYIENYNVGKPVNQQILYWAGKDLENAATKLWLDRTTDQFIQTIAEKYFRVRVDIPCDEGLCKATVPLYDALNTYGYTMGDFTPAQDFIQPHKFFGR